MEPPKQMNHRITSVLISLVIVVAVVSGAVYWEWPVPSQDDRSGVVPMTSTQASTSTIDLVTRATTSVLESLPRPAVGPPPAAAEPTISWAVSQISEVMFPGTKKTVTISFSSNEN